MLASFTVNTTGDTVDAIPGDGVALDASGNTSLRAAIMEANELAGNDVITLPAGTYRLTISGTGEDAAAKGDLDINSNIAITGVGNSNSIIDGAGLDRVFDVDRNVTFSLDKLKVTGGSASGTFPANRGGALFIDFYSTVTITSCWLLDNAAVGTGATGGRSAVPGTLRSAVANSPSIRRRLPAARCTPAARSRPR